MKKSIIAIATYAALTMTAHAASIEAVEGLDVQQPFFQPAEFVQQGQVPVVDLTNVPASQHGQLILAAAKPEIEQLIKNGERKFEVLNMDLAQWSQDLKPLYQSSKAANPEYFETFESLADAIGKDKYYLFALSQTDLVVSAVVGGVKTLAELNVKNSGCTTAAFTDTGIVGQTNDLASLDGGVNVIIKKAGIVYTTLGGFTGGGQAVGEHVGVVINFIGGDSTGHNPAESVDMGAAVTGAAKAKNVDEAIQWLSENRVPVGLNFTLADKYGDAATVEITEEATLVRRDDKGVGHTNHSLRGNVDLSHLGNNKAEIDKNSSWSLWRQEAVNTFIEYTPEKNTDALKSLFSQKPIAQTAAYGSDFITVSTVVIDSKAGCMEFAPGVTQWNNFQKVCIK